MADTEGVEALVGKAEVLLSLAGEPNDRVETLLMAQTNALLALVKVLTPPSPPTKPQQRGSYPHAPAIAQSIVDKYSGYTLDTIANAMISMEFVAPDWWNGQAVMAIKEIRARTLTSLAEAKSLYDDAVRDLPRKWWV